MEQQRKDEVEDNEDNLDIFCDPCETDGKRLSAEGYCVNCDEYLCVDCYKAHLRPSVTRHHMLKDKQCMPRKLRSSTEMCQMHKEHAIEYYCETHKTLCCMACKTTSHENCVDMNKIADILDTVDLHQELGNFKNKVTELAHDVDDTLYQVQTSLKAIAINYNDARSEMCSLRQKINDHFDKVETNIDLKLKKIRDKDFEIINSHKVKCDALLFDISTLEASPCENIVAKHKYKAFVAMKRAENKVTAGHNDLKRIRQSTTVQRYEFVAETGVTNILSERGYFGDIRFTNACKKTLLDKGDLDVKAEDDNHDCLITGMTLISEKYLVVADNNNMSVKLINTAENVILSRKRMDTGPWDITSTKDNQVAVTLPSLEKIQFFRFLENFGLESVKELRVGRKCNGIDFIATENKLIVTSCQPGMVEIIDMEGHVLKSFDLSLNVPHYVSWLQNENQIVISDIRLNKNKTMLDGCLLYVNLDDQKANVQMSIKELDKSSIQPLDLTTDHAKGIFVCDQRGSVFFVEHYNYKSRMERRNGSESSSASTTTATGFNFSRPVTTTAGFNFGTRTSTINTSTNQITTTLGSSVYKMSNEHPDVLINFGSSNISPRSIAHCKKTFTMYVGTANNKIYMYIVA